MKTPLDPRASAADDAHRTLERALADSRTQWNDSVRNAFDQHYAEPITSAARIIASKLADLSMELAAALQELRAIP